MTVKEELLKAARSGDMEAHRQLVKDGVMYAEIFAPDTNKTNEDQCESKISDYIFVVYDNDSDYTNIVMATSNHKKAIECACQEELSLMVWVDGGCEESMDVQLSKWGLIDAKTTIRNEINGKHSKLAKAMLPLIQEKVDEYEEEKRKQLQNEESKTVEKELKELARLKAKYEE